jgi:hypothetical protein
MTKQAVVALFALFILSCKKAEELFNRIPLPPAVDTSAYFQKDTICGLVSQTGYRVAEPTVSSYVAGFAKTYNSSGKVASLTVKVMNGFYSFDSLFYTFYYNRTNHNSLQYSLQTKAYQRFQQTDSFYFAGESGNPEQKNTVLFDPATAYVINIAGLTYEYVNGRLDVIVANKGQTQPNGDSLEFRGPYFHYDENGNLAKIEPHAIVVCGQSLNAIRYTHNTTLQGTGKTIIPALTSEGYTYMLSELMDWVPPAHKNLVTSYEYICGYNAFGELSIPLRFNLSHYVLNEKNQILSFDISDASTNPQEPDSRTITNHYDCVDVSKTRLN